MSFDTKQELVTGDVVAVMTETAAQVIRLEIWNEGGELRYTTLNVAECDALIHVLQAARALADVYERGGVYA